MTLSAESAELEIEARIVDSRIGRDFAPPQYATDGSAGMDLRACLDEPLPIAPGQVRAVGSGVAISIRRQGYMALLAPRSGLGTKHGIVLANTVGVIDADYQDEIRMALFNRGDKEYIISPGERVCQMIILPVARAALKIVGEFSETTARNVGKFGSTGKF